MKTQKVFKKKTVKNELIVILIYEYLIPVLTMVKDSTKVIQHLKLKTALFHFFKVAKNT